MSEQYVTHAEFQNALTAINGRFDRVELSVASLTDELRDFKNEVRGWRSELADDMREARENTRTLKHQIWAAALTVFIGVAGFMYAHAQSILSAFDSGRDTAMAIKEAPAPQAPTNPPAEAKQKKGR